jgi:hypothetical protein
MRHIKRLPELGWRVVTEAHTALWVIEMLSLPAIITGLLSWAGEHSYAMLMIVFIIVLAGTVLVTLAALGYWREVKRGGEAPPVDGPDEWTIAELFYHICPELERNPKDPELREQTASKVLDALSSELITMRGKRFDGARRLPLALVDQRFWPRAKFTFWFLEVDDDVALHARNNELHIDYTGLKVCRAEAMKVWPEPMPLREAARIAYERIRGTPSALAAERFGKTPDGILDHLEGALFLYHRVMAQRAPSTVYEEIPTYLRPQLKIFPNGQGLGYTTDKHPTYVNTRIHADDLEAYIRGATEPEHPGWPLAEHMPGQT